MEPRRGRHWCKFVDNLLALSDIRKGSCSLKRFLGVTGEGIDERKSSKFEEGLNKKDIW